MTKDEQYQNILDLALSEGRKVIEEYWHRHESDNSWSVCLGELYIVGNNEFANWYRKKMNTNDEKVPLENEGGYKYESAMMWAEAVQKVLYENGVETINEIHLD